MSLKMPYISLRIRFMALAVFLTLGSSVVWGYWSWQLERKSLFEHQLKVGEQLVSTMAIPIINALIYEELGIIREGGLLDNFIAEIMSNKHLEVRYAMVLNPDGKVLAHNRFSEYGKDYSSSLNVDSLQTDQVMQSKIEINGERISDLTMPLSIAGKSWGCLRVGLSMEPAYSALRAFERRIILFSFLFSVGALVIYWFIGTYLARPITTLTQHMEEIGDTLPEAPPFDSFRRDEIGLLQKSFISMLQRLNKSEAERNASVAHMLENERVITIGRIVSGVAHEVNNPLAGIEATLYQIENKGGKELTRYTALARQGIERIGRIVAQLSDLSKVSEVNKRSVQAQSFFEDLILFARMALKERNCSLVGRNLCPEAQICLDVDKISQVVLNLVLNAADATGSGGSIYICADLENASYVLEVLDDGPGVPPEYEDQIFNLFYTTKDSGKGSGIGLAVSKGIVERHGGVLELVHPQSGIGALFRIVLPQKN